MAAGVYHAGELAVQRRAGVAPIAARVARSIRPFMPDPAQAFLAAQPHVFVGARDRAGRVWAGILTGSPGFARAADERTVRIAALPPAGDVLDEALRGGAVQVGLLALEPATRRRMRINGVAEARDGVLFVRTRQVYANCPKYIQRREPAGPAPAAPPGPPVHATRPPAADLALLRRADSIVVATAAPDGAADVSHRGGSPGFVVVARDGARLSFGDYRGNAMFNTLGNLEADGAAGVLVSDPDTGRVVQLTGRARVDWDPARLPAFPGAERIVDLDVEAVVSGTAPILAPQRLVERSPHNPPPAVASCREVEGHRH